MKKIKQRKIKIAEILFASTLQETLVPTLRRLSYKDTIDALRVVLHIILKKQTYYAYRHQNRTARSQRNPIGFAVFTWLGKHRWKI